MRRRKDRSRWAWCVALALLLAGCSDDKDEGYPSLVTDMAVMATDGQGTVARVRLDNGTAYDVAAQGVTAGVADTTFRCMASYTLDGGAMHLYGVKPVFSDGPLPEDQWADTLEVEAEELPRHPVKLVSAWRSGGYVNLQVGMLTTGVGKHAFGFCEEAPGQYSLLHLRPKGDAESYTETVYLSMPVPEGVGDLTFAVTTYEGEVVRSF